MVKFGLQIIQDTQLFNGGEQNRIHIVACMLENRFELIEIIFKKISLASDHAGFVLKEIIKK